MYGVFWFFNFLAVFAQLNSGSAFDHREKKQEEHNLRVLPITKHMLVFTAFFVCLFCGFL